MADTWQVDLKDNVLSISGERKEEHREESDDHKTFRLERSFGSFSRSFRLPHNADGTKIRASCQDGVLKVVLPKKTAGAEGTSVAVTDTH